MISAIYAKRIINCGGGIFSGSRMARLIVPVNNTRAHVSETHMAGKYFVNYNLIIYLRKPLSHKTAAHEARQSRYIQTAHVKPQEYKAPSQFRHVWEYLDTCRTGHSLVQPTATLEPVGWCFQLIPRNCSLHMLQNLFLHLQRTV